MPGIYKSYNDLRKNGKAAVNAKRKTTNNIKSSQCQEFTNLIMTYRKMSETVSKFELVQQYEVSISSR